MKYSYRHIITWLMAVSLTFPFAGCSDDESWIPGYDGPDDGVINVHLAMPDPQKVVTRAAEDGLNERTINTLTLAIYDKDGNIVQLEPYSSSDLATDDSSENYATTVRIVLNKKTVAAQKDGGIKLVAVANDNGKICDKNSATITNLYAITDDSSIKNEDKNFVMSGSTETVEKDAVVSLVRTAAKVSLDVDPTVTAKFEYDKIKIKNSAESGYLTSSVNGNSKVTAVGKNSEGFSDVQYLYPTEADNAYVIVKAKYDNKDCYYRVDFYDKEKKEYISVNPNHWYQFVIQKVTGPGYATEEKASRAKLDLDLIGAQIHDHAPTVFSMTCDDIRELGVTREIVYEGLEQDAGKWSDKQFTVKLFSLIQSEMNDIPTDGSDYSELSIEVTKGNDWLQFEYLSTETGSVNPDDSLTPDMGTDNDNPGVRRNYKLGFRKTYTSGKMEGEITVRWKGLSRVIKVVWYRNFSPQQIYSEAKLIIHNKDNGQTYTINDYWSFLAGKGTSSSQSAASGAGASMPRLYGINAGDNCAGVEKIRNEGLHFPVMYGNANDKWWYEYRLTLHPSLSSSDEVRYSIEGSDKLKNNLTFSEDSNHVITIKQNGEKGNNLGYDYETGTFVVTVNGAPYPINLYHTGFFHYDEYKHRVGTIPAKAYYYYEVVGLGNEHWLDRNLGATAAGMWVLNESGSSIVSPPYSEPFVEGSQGGYYLPGDYNNIKDTPENYLYTDLCPPGYRLPTSNEWDRLRNSSNFKSVQETSGVSTYYTSYYATGNPIQGNIYFPKARFMESGSIKGVGNGGYYWTGSEAKGTEKEEIGRWLKALMISGSSTSYISGNVQSFGMSVRCVANVADVSSTNVISFNVKGATHVYLYRKSGDQKIGLMNWPGKAIGTYETMTTGTFNFVYNSAYAKSEVYVIFNYMGDDHRIFTMSNNAYSDTDAHYNMSRDEANGWPVETTSSGGFPSDCRVSIETNNGISTWVCSPPTWVDTFNNDYPIPSGYNRIFLNCSKGFTPYAHHWKEGGATTKWPGEQMKAVNNKSNYYYIDIPNDRQNVIFNGGGQQTVTLTIQANKIYSW